MNAKVGGRGAAALVVALGVLGAAGDVGAIEFQAVHLTGQAAPGTDRTFLGFNTPSINASGQLAFQAKLEQSEGGFQLNMGLFTTSPGGTQLVAREGQSYGGAPAVQFTNSPVLSDAGQVAFTGYSAGGYFSSDRLALWSGSPGGVSLVARTGEAAPGGGTFANVGFATMNGQGQLAFHAAVDHGAGPVRTVWSGTAGAITPVAQVGQPAPGTGHNFSYVDPFPLINNAGQVLVQGTYLDSAENFGVGTIHVGGPGGLQLVQHGEELAPHVGPQTKFGTFTNPSINNAGQVAIWSWMYGGSDDVALFAGTRNNLQLVARENTQAAGLPAGVMYGSMNEPAMANDGRVGFYSLLKGTGVNSGNDTALFAGLPGDVRLVARTGDGAPGTGGALFDGFDFTHLNGSGEGVFLGFLRGDGVTFANDKSVFALDDAGVVHLLGREGDAFTVAPGDVRTILDVDYTRQFVNHAGGDGFPRSINDAGQIALRINFTDGSAGLFVATVPEPGFAALAGLGLVSAGCLRRRAAGR